MCCRLDDISFRQRLAYFSKTVPNHILRISQQHVCREKKRAGGMGRGCTTGTAQAEKSTLNEQSFHAAENAICSLLIVEREKNYNYKAET